MRRTFSGKRPTDKKKRRKKQSENKNSTMRHTSWIGKWNKKKEREDFSRTKNNNNIWLYVFASVVLSVASPRQWNKHMYLAITTVSCQFIARAAQTRTNETKKIAVPPRILARNVDNAESGGAVRACYRCTQPLHRGVIQNVKRVLLFAQLCHASKVEQEPKAKRNTKPPFRCFQAVTFLQQDKSGCSTRPTTSDRKRRKKTAAAAAAKNTMKKCVSAERMYMQRKKKEKKRDETEEPWPWFGRRWNKICTLYNDIHKTRRERAKTNTNENRVSCVRAASPSPSHMNGEQCQNRCHISHPLHLFT